MFLIFLEKLLYIMFSNASKNCSLKIAHELIYNFKHIEK